VLEPEPTFTLSREAALAEEQSCPKKTVTF
jgi:hypothetical protein